MTRDDDVTMVMTSHGWTVVDVDGPVVRHGHDLRPCTVVFGTPYLWKRTKILHLSGTYNMEQYIKTLIE